MFLKLVVGFTLLFFLTKILGKGQIRQMTAFDFISALIIGEFVGNALYDREINLLHITYSLSIWTTLMLIIEFITQKLKGTRRFLEGKADLIIENGKINRELLKQNHLDFYQLQHLLREKDVFQIKDVNYAILETDGTVSVLKKDNVLKTLPVNLINDGEIIYQNLAIINKDKDWLIAELQKENNEKIEQIFSCEYIEGSPLSIQHV